MILSLSLYGEKAKALTEYMEMKACGCERLVALPLARVECKYVEGRAVVHVELEFA